MNNKVLDKNINTFKEEFYFENASKLIQTKSLTKYFDGFYDIDKNIYRDKYNIEENLFDISEKYYNKLNRIFDDLEKEDGRLEKASSNELCTCCGDNYCPKFDDPEIQYLCIYEHIADILACYLVDGLKGIKEYRKRDICASDNFYTELTKLILNDFEYKK